MGNEYDVVIVGAGIAGLTAAKTLLEKKAVAPDKLLIIENLDRVGGRMLRKVQSCDRTPNNPVDVGACWICPEQTEVWKLAKSLDRTIVKQEDRGLRVHVKTNGGCFGWIGRLLGCVNWETDERKCSLYRLPPVDILAYVNLGKRFEKMAKELIKDPEKPWEAQDAEKWDNMTCEEFLVKEVSNEAARGLMRSALLAIFCLPTHQFSMLWFLASLKAEGSFEMFTVGAQSHRVLEGNGSMTLILADQIRDQGTTIQLNTCLTSCEQNDKGVVLTTKTASGTTKLQAVRTIVTVPATQYRDIQFSPPLPQEKYQREMQMGKAIKTVLAYKERWWKNTAAFADPALDVNVFLIFDVGTENEPMLATFYYGDKAVEFSGDDKKRARIAESIKAAQSLMSADPNNPDPRSFEPLSVVEGDWPSVPNILGGYANVPKTGAITRTKMFYRDLVKAYGRVHFAGTEGAERWAGYMEGGIATGKKAGAEVAAAL